MNDNASRVLTSRPYFESTFNRKFEKNLETAVRVSSHIKGVRFGLEAAAITICVYLAYLLRFGGQIPPSYTYQMCGLAGAILASRLLASFLFGTHKVPWRYVSMTDAFKLGEAYALVSLYFLALHFIVPDSWFFPRVPASIIIIELFLSAPAAMAMRVLRRYVYERHDRSSAVLKNGKPRRILLIGAGILGSTVAKEMSARSGIKVIGFLDDDPEKIGKVISGACVLGPTMMLTDLVRQGEVDDALVCIPPKARISSSRIWSLLDHLPVRSWFVPTIEEILAGRLLAPANGNGNGHANGAKPKQPSGHVEVVSRRDPPPEGPSVRGKTILITGGAGFIGSSLAERLAAENQVVLFDRSFNEQPVTFSSVLGNPNVRKVEADIMSGNVLGELAASADIVVHAAAIVGVGRVCNHPRETLETNFVGTSRLLQALEKNPRLERVVYFSTSEVFGVNSFRVHENTPAAVGPAAEARWSYAIAKLAGEHLAKSYHRETGMPIVTVRPFNIFGPRRLGAHAIRSFVLNALSGRPLEVHGDGSQIRSWCYIEDFCDALVQMMVRPEAIGEDFNIGNPRNTLTILQLAQKIVMLTGARVPIVFHETNIPDIDIRVPSLEKAQRLLGYDCKFDMDRALSLTVDWYRRNLSALTASAGRADWPVARKERIERSTVVGLNVAARPMHVDG
jgi:UDP-glucose 4-epimerase